MALVAMARHATENVASIATALCKIQATAQGLPHGQKVDVDFMTRRVLIHEAATRIATGHMAQEVLNHRILRRSSTASTRMVTIISAVTSL